MTSAPTPDAPIGVFDSGIGGLSVLRALRMALPGEDFVYVADSAWTPYGERSDPVIAERTARVARHLRDAHGAKALVIACNTASAVAVHTLRSEHAGWPIVAIEPALKPAAQQTRSGHVAVLATRGTLNSRKYAALRHGVVQTHPSLRFTETACDGLAAAIEQWALDGDASACNSLLERYLGPIRTASGGSDGIDTVVLGCTHYPLILAQIRQRLATAIGLVEAGAPVARHTWRVLHATGLLRSPQSPEVLAGQPGQLMLLATGAPCALEAAAARWLGSPDGPARPAQPDGNASGHLSVRRIAV